MNITRITVTPPTVKKRVYLKQLFDEAGAGDTGSTGNANKDDGKAAENHAAGSGDSNKKTDDPAQNKDSGADDKKYSDADLDKIISQKFAKWKKEQEKAVSEAKKLASMTEQEKAEHERDELQKELDALKKSNALAEMGRQARKMLSDDGINAPDDLVDMIITEDAETTKTNVQQFSKLFKDAVQAAVKEALKGKTPGTGSSGAITKEQIMAIKDPIARQQKIKENIGLFRS